MKNSELLSVFSSLGNGCNAKEGDDSNNCEDESGVTGGNGISGLGYFGLGYFGFLNGVRECAVSILENGVGAILCCCENGSLVGANCLIVNGLACCLVDEVCNFAACDLVSGYDVGEAIGCAFSSLDGVVVGFSGCAFELLVVNYVTHTGYFAVDGNEACVYVVLAFKVCSVYVSNKTADVKAACAGKMAAVSGEVTEVYTVNNTVSGGKRSAVCT